MLEDFRGRIPVNPNRRQCGSQPFLPLPRKAENDVQKQLELLAERLERLAAEVPCAPEGSRSN